jgi:hypothetical protein
MASIPKPLNPIQVRVQQLAKAADGVSAASGGISASIGALQRGVETRLGTIATEIGEIGERPNGGGPSVSNEVLEALIFGVNRDRSFVPGHWFGDLMTKAGYSSLAEVKAKRHTVATVRDKLLNAEAMDPSLKHLTDSDVVVVVRAAQLKNAAP